LKYQVIAINNDFPVIRRIYVVTFGGNFYLVAVMPCQ
jgi:hypothetical protein